MSERSDEFVRNWVSANVQNRPDLDDPSEHIAELVEELLADAEAEGIDEVELSETVGDPYDYLENAFEQVQDAALGFHEPDED